MQKITTLLTYNDQAEQTARLYVSIFEDQCRVVDTVKGPDDEVMTVTFASKDRAAAGRAMQAMMQMKKLDLATLQRPFDGE